jgi:hypothetical protein
MRVQVKPLRHRGARRSDYDIQAMAPAEGGLSIYGAGTTIQITLSALDDQQNKPLIPNLYEARLVNMHGAKMLFAGIERTVDPLAAQYLQEWTVVIISL